MSVIGSALGIGKSGAEKASERAAREFEDFEAPNIQDIDFERFASVGDPRDFLTTLQDTELAKIQTDPALREAQFGALSQLRDIATNEGLTDADKARLAEINREEAIRTRGARESIVQNAAARGAGGSGLELASLLEAESSGADRAAARGRDVAQIAEQRVLDAIRSGASLAGDIRGQEFGEQAAKAEAQDVINRFNVGARNEAGILDFQNEQNVANQNVGLTNQQQLLNRVELPQQRFGNEFDIRQARANALNQVAAQRANREGRFTQLLGSGIQAAGSAAGGR